MDRGIETARRIVAMPTITTNDGSELTLAEIMTEFKEKAGAATAPSEMWAIEDYLRRRRREVDEIFDYRYSQLLLVFARLIDQGYLDEARLTGLAEEKLEIIRYLLSRMRSDSLP
jgi:Photoprotection regulator fluorescence recovery protein